MLTEANGPLVLIAATPESLAAEAVGGDRLADWLGVAGPASWPPEHNDADTRAWMLRLLADHPDEPGYGFWYIVADGRLVGIAGFKGPPDATGVVEIGYSVIESEQRRGHGVAAAAILVARAFRDRRVWTIIAETLPALTASQTVLTRNGFKLAGSRPDDDLGEVLRFVLTRP